MGLVTGRASKSLVVALVAFLLVAAATWGISRQVRSALSLVHPSRHRVADDVARRAFSEIDNLQNVVFRTSDGLSIRGWFSPGRRRAGVILVHGLMGNRATLEPEAAVLAHHGYAILLFDLRAEGDSDGHLATWGDREQNDVEAALDYVSARPEIDPKRIALLGFSIGGSTVVMVAARDPRVRAVILYATWTSLRDEIRTNYSRWGPLSWVPTWLTMRASGVDFENVRPIDFVASVAPRPLLMIAGGHDEDTPVSIMRKVFARAGEPKQLWVVPEAGHGGVFQARPSEYESRVASFLDSSIGKDPPDGTE